MFVKICGITNEQDALLSIAMGADALGFIFAPSKRQVAVDRVRDITRRLPPEILTVGVFRDELPDRVIEQTRRAGLRAVQLHGSETAEQTAKVRAAIPIVIKAFPAGHPGLRDPAPYGADVILVDSDEPGSGEVFDWREAEKLPRQGSRLLLAGGLRPDNVVEAIARVRPWGVDVASGVEKAPGVKDAVKVREFVAAARHAFESAPEDDEYTLPTGDELYDWEQDLRA